MYMNQPRYPLTTYGVEVNIVFKFDFKTNMNTNGTRTENTQHENYYSITEYNAGFHIAVGKGGFPPSTASPPPQVFG